MQCILYCNNRNKSQFSRDIYETDSIWWYNHLQRTTTVNMTKMGKADIYIVYVMFSLIEYDHPHMIQANR